MKGRAFHISRARSLFVLALILFALAKTGTAWTEALPEAELESWPSDFRMVMEPGKENTEAVVFHMDTSSGYDRDKHHDDRNSSPLFSTGFSLSTGYRRDHLKWSIAGPDNSPNVLSELEWDDVESLTLSGKILWTDVSRLYVRGLWEVGWILDGKCRDSDYLADNRKYEFSRSYCDTSSGSLLEGSMGLGYRMDLSRGSQNLCVSLVPLAGYAWHSQELEMTHGYQVVSNYGFEMPLGPFGGLQSSYKARWYGPWLGLDLNVSIEGSQTFSFTYEYHWTDYQADGNWNLRSDFEHPVSFSHDARGRGFVTGLSYGFRLSPLWALKVRSVYRQMDTGAGHDMKYFSDDTGYRLRFNKVEWESCEIGAGLVYFF